MGTNIHASCVDLSGQGILLFGPSGSGKSDLSLRLIMEFGAKLVADDRTNLIIKDNELIASAPTILEGLIEVRGIGIINLPFCKQSKIKLAINLVSDKETVERLPKEDFFEFKNKKIRCFNLNGKEASAPSKILSALTLV